MQSTPLLQSLPGPLWTGVVAPDRVLSMSQIELNCVLMLNWIVWSRTVFDIETASSSSSCRAISKDIPDPLSPLLPIVHRFWQVLRATSRIFTELLYVGSSWSPCFCLAMWRGPIENIIYELVPASPAVSCISGSSNLDSFRDGR